MSEAADAIRNEVIARANICAWVMDATGPEYQAAGEAFAGRILAIITRYAADTMIAREPAIAQAVAAGVATTLGLVARSGSGRRS